MQPVPVRLWVVLLNCNKGVPRELIDECDSLLSRCGPTPMKRLIQQMKCSDSRFRRETLESQGGALHLILFDTSPLLGFMQMCTKHTFVYSVNCLTDQGLLFRRCTLVHTRCTLSTHN